MLIRLFIVIIVLVAVMLNIIKRFLSMFTKGQFFVFGVLFGWCVSQMIGVGQPW